MTGDRITLEGMTFYAYHGVSPEERALGQRFVVDLEAEADLRPAGASDNLADTVDYSEVYWAVKEVMEGPPRNLLEALAEAIVGRVLTSFPAVQAVRVRVSKPSAPIKGAMLSAARVEVYRRRGD
ncbi:MAG: dihydroneopterin aldolase [Chloroflexi bacterium]|nr:dihydroneopterin aldolase [Chloroflexota bacterium]